MVGESLKIGSEIVYIVAVDASEITLSRYHRTGTEGLSVNVYQMDNRIGIGRVLENSNNLTEINNGSFESLVGQSDYNDAKPFRY